MRTAMSPIDWAIRPLKKYTDFEGRASRAEYWWFSLAFGLAGLLVDYVDSLVGGPVVGVYGPLSLIVTLSVFIPGLAVTIRRLHDIERSGWWILLSAGSYVLVIAGLVSSDFEGMSAQLGEIRPSTLIIAALAWVAMAITLLVFMVTRGTEGPNNYGDDPYGPDRLEEVFA